MTCSLSSSRFRRVDYKIQGLTSKKKISFIVVAVAASSLSKADCSIRRHAFETNDINTLIKAVDKIFLNFNFNFNYKITSS
jgi:hypothetical protein